MTVHDPSSCTSPIHGSTHNPPSDLQREPEYNGESCLARVQLPFRLCPVCLQDGQPANTMVIDGNDLHQLRQVPVHTISCMTFCV